MKHNLLALLLLLLLSACTDFDSEAGPPDSRILPDAGAHLLDAAPPQTGCNMGNLPTSRTQTFTDGDPIPPAFLNEVQDMIVGDRRPVFPTQFFPTCWFATGTAPTLVVNPAAGPVLDVWKIPTAQTVRTRIPFEGGVTLSSFTIDAYGDAAVDWVGTLTFSVDQAGTSGFIVTSNGGGVVNQPSVWTKGGGFAAPVGTPLTADGVLYLDLVVSGGSFLWVGGIYPHFTR